MMETNKYLLQLICSLIYVIFTVSTLTGQSCSDLVGHINSQVQGIITGTETSNSIYSSYSSSGNSTWATQNWTGQVDFSGVAFDKSQTSTLISPRHILMATHFQRNIGDTIVFHDSTGLKHTATLIAKQSVPGGNNPDITVGLLDSEVPVKYYKVLPARTNWLVFLNNALVVSTHHTRTASLREVRSTFGLYIRFGISSAVPTSYYASVVGGNSGNPNFLLINGEPILIQTFTFSNGVGPFFSHPSNFNAINSIMTSLGGGYQLETVDMCEESLCFPYLPSVSLDLRVSEVCINESPIILSGGSPASNRGIYTGTGVSDNTFNPMIAGVGDHQITYSYVGPGDCMNSATATITVHASSPPPSLDLVISEACITETNIILSGGSPVGGSYSGISVSRNTFNPRRAGIGNHQITYSYRDSLNCTNSVTDTFTVHDIPSTSLDLDVFEVCINESPIILNGGSPAGGFYTGSGIGVGVNTFDPMNAGIGNHLITYTYTDSLNCINSTTSATDTFTVHGIPSISLDLAVSEACITETNIELSGGSPAGGSYSGIGVSGNTFNPMTAGGGNHLITYTYTDSTNCMNSTTATFTVNGFSPNSDSIEISNTISDSTYEATNKIISTSTLASGTEVNFYAGKCIVLSPNFTVSAGAEFTAKILTPCTSSSTNTLSIPQTNQAKLLAKIETTIKPTLKISPNPFSDQSRVEINLPEKDVVNITVFDQTGRKVKVLVKNKLLESGKHIFHLKELQSLSGLLFINMSTTKTLLVKKAILIKNGNYRK